MRRSLYNPAGRKPMAKSGGVSKTDGVYFQAESRQA